MKQNKKSNYNEPHIKGKMSKNNNFFKKIT
jgi:hypothetical protein